ncbi:MAG: DUF3667 domain-containing protein [Bacteroidota bacterium]
MQPADTQTTPADAPVNAPTVNTVTADLPVAASPACANCGHEVVGDFCAACGQKSAPLRQPVHRFVASAAGEYFGLDGRLWRTLGLLLTQPGTLTRAYLDGRRARYLRPLRLYLTATLTFFFLLAVLDPVANIEGLIVGGDEDRIAADSTMTAAAWIDTIDSGQVTFDARVDQLRQVADSLLQAGLVEPEIDSETGDTLRADLNLHEIPEEHRPQMRELVRLGSTGRQRAVRRLEWQRAALADADPDSSIRPADWQTAAEIVIPSMRESAVNLPDWMPRSRAIERLNAARTSDGRTEAATDLARGMIARVPTVMFLLLPLFALLLKLVYIRRGWYYSEHLVFALHGHAFAFLVFTVVAVLLTASGAAAWALRVSQALGVAVLGYFFIAQKRVYGQGWLKTGAKALGLGVVYTILLFWGFIGSLVLAAAL